MEQMLAHTEWVRALVRRLLGSAREADVDDLVQDTMLRAFSTPPDTQRPVRGWLATVARRLFHERHRRQTRRAAIESHGREPNRLPTPDEMAELAERQRIVVGCVLAMPDPYRHTLLLHYLHDTPDREIAQELKLPLATVRSQLQRGRALLREALERYFGDRGEDWRAALLPLAGWPNGDVPPLAEPVPQLRVSRLPGWAATAALLLVGGVVASVWWGDWATDWVEPQAAHVDSDTSPASEGPGTRRTHVDPGARPANDDRLAGAGDAHTDPDDAAVVGAVPAVPPDGAIRVRVTGLEVSPSTPVQVLVEALPARLADAQAPGGLPSRTAKLEADVSDLDLRALFGSDAEVHEVDVRLLHPAVVPQTVRAVPAGPGDEGVEVRFDTSPAAILTGRVLGPDRQPVAGAAVLAGMDESWLRPNTERWVVDEITTGADGAFRLRVPPKARVAVIARAPGLDAGWADAAALGPGEEATLDVLLPAGESISGRVLLPPGETGLGLHVVAVEHRNDDREFRGRHGIALLEGGRAIQTHARAAVAADGSFVLRGLSRWEYRVQIEHPDGPDATSVRESAIVVCAAPWEGLELEQHLVAVPFVVCDTAAVPIAGASVSALDGARLGVVARASTDESGRATLELRRGMEFHWFVGARGRSGAGGVLRTPLSGPGVDVAVELEQPHDASWRVRIEDQNGAPVRNAAFEVRSATTGVRRGFPHELTSRDGEFVIEGLPPGQHEIGIRIGTSWTDTRTYWHEITRRVNVPNDAAVETVTLGRDVSEGGRLRLLPRAEDRESVFGRVTLIHAGRSIPCRLAWRQYSGLRTSTDTSLSPQLVAGSPNDLWPVLEPGIYELEIERISAPPCPEIRRTVTIVAGAVEQVPVDLTAR